MADTTLAILLPFILGMTGLVGGGIGWLIVRHDRRVTEAKTVQKEREKDALKRTGNEVLRRKNIEIHQKDKWIKQQDERVAYLQAQLSECLKRRTG